MATTRGTLTKLSDICQLYPLPLIKNLAIITFAGNVDAENNCLIDHLVKVHGCANILGNLRLGINEEIPCDMHQLDQRSQILLDRSMIEDNECCALLRADAFVRIVET